MTETEGEARSMQIVAEDLDNSSLRLGQGDSSRQSDPDMMHSRDQTSQS